VYSICRSEAQSMLCRKYVARSHHGCRLGLQLTSLLLQARHVYGTKSRWHAALTVQIAWPHILQHWPHDAKPHMHVCVS
jgi:hypothetical protein